MLSVDESKRQAAERSMAYVKDGMHIGLGTGSTAKHVLELLGQRVRDGLRIVGVPSSEEAAGLARQAGIPLATFTEVDVLDLAIDGADEVGPQLALIKGGGGALLHEKIVASAAKEFIVVAGEGKVVPMLGRFPLPVEVIRFAAPLVERKLAAMGGNPVLRMKHDVPYLTDEGNWIYDCRFGSIPDPERTAAELRGIIGVVEHGLFLNMATRAIVVDGQGVSILER
jgi:ribose 5-phosphate isomerase A